MSDLSFLTPAVRALPVFGGVPTVDALDEIPGGEHLVLLHLNECPYPPSPRVVEAIARHAAETNRYGAPRPARLARAVERITGVPAANIVFGNGSDEILALTCQMCLTIGTSAVMPTPSFPRYRLGTRMAGAEARMVRTLPDGRNDVAGILAAIDRTTRVVFACTPNNPSGAPLAQDEIRALCQGVPDDVLLVVDEAYFEFDAFEGGIGALPELQRRKGPWLSTRTFSKAFALAGMRVGYGLAGSRDVAEGLVRVKSNFNVSLLAIVAAEAALADEAYARGCIGKAVDERRRLAGAIGQQGFPVLPTRANFVSFDYGINSVPLIEAMARDGVLVREWRDPGFETYVRFSVGLPEENDRALHALVKAVELDRPRREAQK